MDVDDVLAVSFDRRDNHDDDRSYLEKEDLRSTTSTFGSLLSNILVSAVADENSVGKEKRS